ncbi:MAG: bacterial transcriptional activator domain-containing protein, partial [Candidatus Kapaibacterium sp.]
DKISASNGKDLVARLEHYGLLKPVFADPDQVTFVHDSISEAERELRSEVDLADVAGMIVMSAELRENIDRWTYDTDLFRLILRALPAGDSAERREVLAHFTTPIPMYKILDQLQHWIEVHEAILAERALLAPRELARILVIASSLDFFSEDRLAAAVEKAEEFYRLASSEPSCADLLAESCASLGIARFFRDRTTDVSDLLKEAAGAIDQISDPRERMVAEMQILKLRVTIVPVNRLQEGVAYARRFCHLAEQLGMHEERYSMLGTLAIHTARIRDDEQLRLFCADLLRDLRSGTGAKSQLFNTVINTVRAAIAIGDIFLAREIFEALSSRLAPLGAGEYVRHCYLTALFALIDGRPSIAADAALSGRKEFLEYSASTSSPFWNISFIHAALQITMMQSLIAAGRYTEAAEVSEQMAGNNDNTNLPDSSYVLGLFNFWLRWRCLLPADAAISLCWPRDIPALESDAPGLPPAYDSGAAAEAGERFRRFCHDTMTGVSPPPRFFAGTLLAMIECAEKNFPEAMRLLDMAAEACKQMYDWRYDLEIRISRITLRLRWAQFVPEMAESLVNESIDMARDLCSMMAERGLVLRVAQVAELFREEAHLIAGASHRDYGGQFERIGAAAQTAAHVVMRNSRSAEAGPIDRARLFVMGPLRLMRSHSYMEISESAFGREAARTLLIVLVAAAVLDRAPTREEIAACVALKARSPEQQKKALYNAASAARAACGSLNSILNISANNLELNINPDLEGSVWVDALEILRAVRHGGELDRAGEHGAAFDEYQRALMLARKGEFASDIYAEWIEAARVKLSDAVRRAALSVARIALRTGLYQAGIEAINAQLTRDQFDEEAHRALIRLFKESGNRIAALKQLEKCRKLIKREFGVEPERETLRLRQELIA